LGATAAEVGNLLSAVSDVCRSEGITLVGGHTEVTDAVRRPVVSGMLVGTAQKEGILRKRDAREGDVLILTKGVAVEGTSIIAREFATRMRGAGVPDDLLSSAQKFLNHLSVKKDAALAVQAGGVRAMHDVTEGGLATAVRELSEAAGREIHVQMQRIPILTETQVLCERLGLDPLGLIGSGSLLIVADQRHGDSIVDKLEDAGIAATAIGKMGASLPAGVHGVIATRDGEPVTFPEFPADELARLYGS
jgi:hydrogenase maturation factor